MTVTSVVATGSRLSRLHLALLRVIARTGHVRRGATFVRPFFPRGDAATVTLSSGGRLHIDLSDAHWARVPAGLPYEPAVERVLSISLARPDTYLIDCGANIGYWSSYFASRTQVVAVEPNPDLFAVLSRHASLNGFDPIQAAVWSVPGELVDFGWSPDEQEAGAVTTAPARGAARSVQVATTTLDTIHDEYGAGRTAVVKLDVEGVELPAVDGGDGVLRDGLLVYEDHGSDVTHATTQGLIGRGFEIRWPHEDGRFERIADIRRLDALKVRPRSGYNLVAFRPASQWGGVF